MEPIVPSVDLSRRIRQADCAYTPSRVGLARLYAQAFWTPRS